MNWPFTPKPKARMAKASLPDPLCGLERAACLAQYAHVTYLFIATFYRLDVKHWDALTFQERHVYHELAQRIAGELKPVDRSTWPEELFQHVASVARTEASKVVGHISPSEPYGVNDPSDIRD